MKLDRLDICRDFEPAQRVESSVSSVGTGGNQESASLARDFRKGYLVRKCCSDPGGRRTPRGKRGWKSLYAKLSDLLLLLHKDEKSCEEMKRYFPGLIADLMTRRRSNRAANSQDASYETNELKNTNKKQKRESKISSYQDGALLVATSDRERKVSQVSEFPFISQSH